jgi:hypothetical protein
MSASLSGFVRAAIDIWAQSPISGLRDNCKAGIVNARIFYILNQQRFGHTKKIFSPRPNQWIDTTVNQKYLRSHYLSRHLPCLFLQVRIKFVVQTA